MKSVSSRLEIDPFRSTSISSSSRSTARASHLSWTRSKVARMPSAVISPLGSVGKMRHILSTTSAVSMCSDMARWCSRTYAISAYSTMPLPSKSISSYSRDTSSAENSRPLILFMSAPSCSRLMAPDLRVSNASKMRRSSRSNSWFCAASCWYMSSTCRRIAVLADAEKFCRPFLPLDPASGIGSSESPPVRTSSWKQSVARAANARLALTLRCATMTSTIFSWFL
mmetsp:Transcript_23846/g.47911  ORF Transcript_23846/g.47911 Transcript_23846/m.47911 type:complete len:226 (+) Transcript_23846:176-853(+)